MAAVEVNKINDHEKKKKCPSPDFSVKHSLQNSWTLWYSHNDTKSDWAENQRQIATFNTVEDFWSLFNHIKKSNKLDQGQGYALFKTGIRPMWEDEANTKGGRWLINLEKRKRDKDLNKYWQEVLLLLIGEGFDEHSDDVSGAVVNRRVKGGKIGVWTMDAHKCLSVVEIGRKLKERLFIGRDVTMNYQVHLDTMMKTGAVANIQ
ncbi:eukaryotic translation initiation factor 4E-like [Anabrus simplex]|uniref:eukaryotic translation initiation factor 4E-like n=1 Tax=Anabrus simplex TaxID=316456 RepID=UPI0035A270B9